MSRLVIGAVVLRAVLDGCLALRASFTRRLPQVALPEPYHCTCRAVGIDIRLSLRRGDLLRHNASNMTAEVVLADADGVLILFEDGSTANFRARQIADDWKLAWSAVPLPLPPSLAPARAQPAASAEILPFVRPSARVLPFRPHGAA